MSSTTAALSLSVVAVVTSIAVLVIGVFAFIVKYGNGLAKDGSTVAVKLSANAGNQISFDSAGALFVPECVCGTGLSVSGALMSVQAGSGISVNNSGVNVKYGHGLAVSNLNSLMVRANTGIISNASGVFANTDYLATVGTTQTLSNKTLVTPAVQGGFTLKGTLSTVTNNNLHGVIETNGSGELLIWNGEDSSAVTRLDSVGSIVLQTGHVDGAGKRTKSVAGYTRVEITPNGDINLNTDATVPEDQRGKVRVGTELEVQGGMSVGGGHVVSKVDQWNGNFSMNWDGSSVNDNLAVKCVIINNVVQFSWNSLVRNSVPPDASYLSSAGSVVLPTAFRPSSTVYLPTGVAFNSPVPTETGYVVINTDGTIQIRRVGGAGDFTSGVTCRVLAGGASYGIF